MYCCLTCGIKGIHGICEACALNCHQKHDVVFMGIHKFKCFCKEKKSCKMMNAQALRDSRIICDRKVLGNDDRSPCYICSTCDKEGNNPLCETCALKSHTDHEIHFIGNMAFNCKENGCFV